MFWRRNKSRAPHAARPKVVERTSEPREAPSAPPNYDVLKSKSLTRSDMHCTECNKLFIASLDMALDGNHIIECPYCRHEHCRVVDGGKVTEERWSSRHQRVDVPARRVWKSDKQPIATSTASAFIRDRWLNFGNDDN